MFKTFFTGFLAVLTSFLFTSLAGAESRDLRRFLPQDCHHWGTFIQEKRLAALTQPLTSEGRFAFSCEAGLLWHNDIPLRETLVYPLKTTAWRLDAEGQKEMLTSPFHKQLGNLLNRLIGGDLDYLNRHFHLRDQGNSLALVPKAARMKKFVQNIHVTPTPEQVEIVMTHADNESTYIGILAREPLPVLQAENCIHVLPDLVQACQGLFPNVPYDDSVD